MAKLPSKFNADDHEDMGNFEAIDAGEYQLKISGNKKKDNKAKVAAASQGEKIEGSVYTITFEVTSGKFKSRLLFVGLNLEHTSKQTVEIAYKELKAIAVACGKKVVNDLDELNGLELMGTVKVVAATSQYPASNKITKYSSLKGAAKVGNPANKTGKPKAKVSFD